ncbi:SDR family NAD(P)-dependent oxidoreductase [bacterium]|nr:SDR family NAD(P)-dependent oxidoreductase [bacterium]
MSVNKSVKTKDQPENMPIAIIGMGCLFPKAGDRQSFWRILRTGADCIGPVPETHWSVNDLYDGDHSSPDRCYAKMGGFLEPYPFDPTEFNIPPNVLEATDTSQLLGLVGAKAALEDAGYGQEGKELPKDRTSVILGVTGALEMVIPLGARLGHPRWRKALAQAGIDKETSEKIIADIADSYVSWQENSFPGLLGNVVAGRIANRLDLHGTNCAVDAACASSLAAVHLAVSELQAGQADVCLTGGTDTFNDIFMFTCFSKTPALSDSGRISPFSESCDGTLLGEGIGVLVLKRLADAERDNDRIYAVIKGMGTSSDGNSGAIYAPSAPGQAMALRRAYEESAVDPKTVEVVEAHGTGTKVGDAVEFKALKEVYLEAGAAPQSCALGTVKSQIGHTKASAGAASLCKAAFSLFHKVILPTLNVSRPNPKLEIEDSPFYLNTSVRPWISNPHHPRRIGVSSFGFGGANYHAVLEEHKPERLAPAWDGSVQIWPFSAADKQSLIASVRSAAACKPYESAYQACLQRETFDHKAPCRAVIVTGPADYAEKLAALADALENGKEQSNALPEDAYYGDVSSELGKVAFLFPGQGSQYVRMGSELFSVFPEALQVLECAQQTLKGSGQAPAEYIFPKPRFTENEEEENTKALTDTKITQPSLGAMESAMAAVLERFEVVPQAMAGHSFGELVALQRAQVYSQKDLFSLSALRGALMAAGDGGRGAMAAVSAPLADIEAIVAEVGGDLVLANRNHPTQGVISGTKEALAKAEELCKAKKMTAKRLQVSAAFHSSLMRSARDPFFSALEQTEFKTPVLPVYANMTGKLYGSEAEKNRQTLADQLVSSVRFIDIVEDMYAEGFRTFIEVGPKTVLTGLVKKILGKNPCNLLSTDGRKGGDELKNIALTLARLAALGYAVKLAAWEEKVAKPRHKRMEVPICGANYRTPGKKAPAPWSDPHEPAENYQPIKFVSDNPPVMPAPTPIEKLEIVELNSQNQAAAPAEPAAIRSSASNSAAYSPVKDSPVSNTVFNSQPAAAVSPAAPIPSAGSSSVLLEAFKTIQSGLSAMQVLQEQTASAHMRFLESQEQIQRSLQSIISAQQGLAQVSLKPQALQTLHVMPALHIPAPAAFSQPTAAVQPAAPKIAAQPQPETLSFSPMAGYSANEPLPVPISSPKNESRDSGNQNLQLPKAPQEKPQTDAAVAVLSVVSEMTGYPADMLRLDMNLETDLGIDSIKRVEILSAIQRSLPQAKTIAPDEIGSLQTLQQIIERLGVSSAAPQPKTAPAVPAVPASPEPKAEPAARPQGSAEKIVMKVVTETTGYPEEAVNLDMDLENDLGVDSIKRVEILAAIQKALPDAAQIAPDELSSLHTLRQILNKLQPESKASPLSASESKETVSRPSAPEQNLQSGSVAETIISVIAEMTGYPVETLNPDLDLENDLGIDSIKRVEILAAIQKALPNVKDIAPSELTDLHTIKDIIARLSSDPHDPQGGPSPSDPDKDKKKDHNSGIDRKNSGPDPHSAAALGGALFGSEPPLLRRRLRYLPSPRPSQSAETANQGLYLILGDKNLGRALKNALTLSGKQAEFIPVQKVSDLMLPQKFSVIAVMEHTDIKQEEDVYKTFRQSQRSLKELFRSVRAVCQACNKKKIHPQSFTTVTCLDGAFGTERPDFQPIEAGLHGLARVMANEYPQTVCRAFDVDSQLQTAEAAALIAEELKVKGSNEVGLSAQTRRIAVLQEDRLNLEQPNPSLPARPVIIVTGGARGVTADCAKTLAKACRPRFILIGRSPVPRKEAAETAQASTPQALKSLLYTQAKARGLSLTPKDLEATCRQILANREALQNIAELEAAGSEALYISADVQDFSQVKEAVNLAKKRFERIDGVIHGAGVLADRYIADKTDEQFNRVFDTKICGLYNLCQALKDEPLKFVLTFSSVSARFGRPGQCDYAMANEVMNKFTHFASFRHPQTRYTAMGWGPWEGGMVDAALKRVFEELKVEVIARPKGTRALAEEVIFGRARDAELIMGEGFDVPSEPQPKSSDNAPRESFRRTLNLQNYSFLQDHVINGRPVMPIALMVELAAQACRSYFPEYKFLGCDKLRVLHPIALPADKNIAAEKRAQAESDLCISADKLIKEDNLLQAELTFWHSDGSGERRKCVVCTALLGKERPDNSKVEFPRTQTAAAADSRRHNIEDIYKNYLFHGPSLKGIDNIERHSPNDIVVNARNLGGLPLSQPDGEALTDPLFLDCALQTGLIFSGLEQGSCSLPMYCGRYRQYVDKFPASAKIALVASDSNPQQLRGDIYIEHDGDILAHLGDVHWTVSPGLAESFRRNRL